MRILVVDDDPIFCTLSQKRLAECGSVIDVAHDGATALQSAGQERFDLALIDLGLPDIDGFDLITRIHAMPHAQHLPIVVVTGREDSEAIDSAYAAGATSFLTKPINWKLFEHHVLYVMRASMIERDARLARVRAEAESRIKDQVTSRVNNVIWPRVRQMVVSAERISVGIERVTRSEPLLAEADALLSCANLLKDDLSGMIFLTRAVSGDLSLHDDRFNVSSLLSELTRGIVDLVKSKGMQVAMSLPAREIEIEADREKLHKALRHLAENAIRYSPARTSLTIAADVLSDGSLSLSIADEGPGIAPDFLAMLLAPLSGEQPVHGERLSGLGLAMTKLIAEGHGGSLFVRSAVGDGTTAGILLPPDRVLVGLDRVA